MHLSANQVVPVVVSILIILTIAVLRAYSRTAAAITATMPINIPLSVWIVAAAEGGRSDALRDYLDAVMVGIGATVVFTVAVWLAARAGWGVGPMLVTGYGVWALTLGLYYLGRALLSG